MSESKRNWRLRVTIQTLISLPLYDCARYVNPGDELVPVTGRTVTLEVSYRGPS